ncbi:MAG: MFS transporter, partial [Marivirga sp.]|nr:MFS transporter [Marivirga sp.]
AQGFFVLISYGIGQGLGTLTSGWIYNTIMGGGDNTTLQQWQMFWFIPLIFSVVVTLLFALGFKDSK